ncbi:MAG: hypothetical protein KAG97_11235, partial [Victivallales bacterium]|nr:hypothetical protein [Victivallales bacterium]
DYLEIFPDEEEIARNVKRFADWLMRERHDHDGVMGWSYQHYYNDKRKYFDFYSGDTIELPTKPLWHVEYLARIMMFMTMRYRDASYFNAWSESHQGSEDKPVWCGDHQTAQVLQYIPWMEDNLWRVQLRENSITASPVWLGGNTPLDAVVDTPSGRLKMTWSDDGRSVQVGETGIETSVETDIIES